MGEDGGNGVPEDVRIDPANLPEVLTDLWETMLRLDPAWDLAEWLEERAKEELDMVSSSIEAERCRIEQRLHRIERLGARLARLREAGPMPPRDPGQRNLFEPYAKVDTVPPREPVEQDEEVVSIDFEDLEDDPLLAIVREHVLQFMESDEEPVGMEEVMEALCPHGIDPMEVHEAIECLVATEALIEIGEGFFVLGG